MHTDKPKKQPKYTRAQLEALVDKTDGRIPCIVTVGQRDSHRGVASGGKFYETGEHTERLTVDQVLTMESSRCRSLPIFVTPERALASSDSGQPTLSHEEQEILSSFRAARASNTSMEPMLLNLGESRLIRDLRELRIDATRFAEWLAKAPSALLAFIDGGGADDAPSEASSLFQRPLSAPPPVERPAVESSPRDEREPLSDELDEEELERRTAPGEQEPPAQAPEAPAAPASAPAGAAQATEVVKPAAPAPNTPAALNVPKRRDLGKAR